MDVWLAGVLGLLAFALVLEFRRRYRVDVVFSVSFTRRTRTRKPRRRHLPVPADALTVFGSSPPPKVVAERLAQPVPHDDDRPADYCEFRAERLGG
jgi:hypothetical protein